MKCSFICCGLALPLLNIRPNILQGQSLKPLMALLSVVATADRLLKRAARYKGDIQEHSLSESWLTDDSHQPLLWRYLMKNPPLDRITIDPDICHGKPCIRGLRYPVEFLLELLSSGMTHAEILEDYDDLEEADIVSVLVFATRLSQVKSVFKLAS